MSMRSRIKTPSFQAGKSYRCIHSKSCAYRKGEVYEVVVDEDGSLVMLGGDGLTDKVSMLCSKFEEVSES